MFDNSTLSKIVSDPASPSEIERMVYDYLRTAKSKQKFTIEMGNLCIFFLLNFITLQDLRHNRLPAFLFHPNFNYLSQLKHFNLLLNVAGSRTHPIYDKFDRFIYGSILVYLQNSTSPEDLAYIRKNKYFNRLCSEFTSKIKTKLQ